MASNPIQKKSRNSFILGMMLMLIVAAIAMFAMFLLLTKNNKNKKTVEKPIAQKEVYVVVNEIKSGQEVTDEDLVLTSVNLDAIPDNAYFSGDLYDVENGIYKEIKNSENEYESVPKYITKATLLPGTVLTDSVLYESGALQASERIQEYNMLQLPVKLEVGDFVDVRFQITNGQDFIVVSHKEVMEITSSTIWLKMNEEEILLMSNAMVESYVSPATNLYVTKYVDPGMQEKATVTYIPSADVITLISEDPNILNTAKVELLNRYNSLVGYRNSIQSEVGYYSEQRVDNVQTQISANREKAQQERENFLNGIQ